MEIKLEQIKTGFAGERCYVHARGAVSPDGMDIVITTQPLRLSGSDIFYGLEMLRSTDGGKNWSPITPQPELSRQPWGDGCEIVMSDATPLWHRTSGKFILIGHAVIYRDDEIIPPPRPRFTLYSIFDRQSGKWSQTRILQVPEKEPDQYFSCGAGCTQYLEKDNGEILLPVYFMSRSEAENPWGKSYHTMVLRCDFNGDTLKVLECGAPLSLEIPRGLGEPSIAAIGDHYYLTMRNDKKGYVADSTDGLHFSPIQEWLFDDGSELGNYCTQQHWITAGKKLYLVYTRRGADNDHVFRHRAPLFIAEVDRKNLRVIRSTEQIAVPQRGARLGNFGCVHIDDHESWVIAAEWMQNGRPGVPTGEQWKQCMEYGSDNSIFISRIKL